MSSQVDLLIIGAGPAGLSAACAARACGLEVVLVDEQPAPGGQLLRNIETPMAKDALDSKEYTAGMQLVRDFYNSGATYLPETTVWGCEQRSVFCTTQGKPVTLLFSSLVVASGAMERPVPFPGWTLPGVMGAGGADILLRSGGSLCPSSDSPVVLAGNGPLLLLLAQHLLHAGVKIAAWLDTGTWSQRIIGAGLLPLGILDREYLVKGMKMGLQILKNKIPIIRGVSHLQALGTGRLEAVRWHSGEKTHELPAHALLRHEGVIPRTHITRALNVHHLWDSLQRCWYPSTTEDGETSIERVFVTGDGACAHGGDIARLKGALTGVAVARKLGVISEGEALFRTAETRKELHSLQRARAFLRHIFAPNPEVYNVPDETLVCRCECVTAADIRRAVAEGFREVNEVKRFTRCGMGPCQGRMCGPALAEIVSAAQSLSPEAVGALQIRQPLRPVSLQHYCEVSLPK